MSTKEISMLPAEVTLFEEFLLNYVGKMSRLTSSGTVLGTNNMTKVTLDKIYQLDDRLFMSYTHDDPNMASPDVLWIAKHRIEMYLDAPLVAILVAYGFAYNPKEPE